METRVMCIPEKIRSLHDKCMNDLYPVNCQSVMVRRITWYLG